MNPGANKGNERMNRFFSEDSFWNTPLPADPTLAPNNESYRQLLETVWPLHINIRHWTIPIYYADTATPRYVLRAKLPRCPISQGFRIASQPWLDASHPCGLHQSVRGGIPIPAAAAPDDEGDAHLSVLDLDARRGYDLWLARRDKDGGWSTNAAIAYDLDGPGVYDPADFANVHNNESIHYYGPCRASGVPAIAGLILCEEVLAGRIAHKLAFACPVPALQEFCTPPAIWTDGWRPGGIPEGIVMQLDPAADIDGLGLSRAGRIVARALQEYGAVLVDYAGATTLYAQGENRSQGDAAAVRDTGGICWDDILQEWDLQALRASSFRFLAPKQVTCKGSHPVYHNGMSALYYPYAEAHPELFS